MKKVLILSFLLLVSSLVNAQKKYDKLWNEIEKLELEGKFKSAYKIADKIFKKAKRSNKSNHIVKSFIYKSKFSLQLEEDSQRKIIIELEAYIDKASFPTNALLESVYAGYLEQYLQANRYKIRKRTPVEFPKESNDFEKWDANTFVIQIDRHYRASLKEEDRLKKRPIEGFEILLSHSKTSQKFRPTLFDFLAHRAIKFYSASKWYVKRPKEQFYINNPVVFAASDLFIKEPFFTKDSVFSNRNVLKLYQKLEAFHQQKNTTAYADVVLNRLQFSKQNATIENKETLFLKALQNLSLELGEDESSSFINYHLADYYYKKSQRYNAKKDPKLKNNRIEALAICNKVISKFPNSDGGLLCKILKSRILDQSLSIEIEKYMVPEKPFLAKVTFKSVDSLYLSIYKVPHQFIENLHYTKRDSAIVHLIKHKKPSTIEFYKLQPQKDFYNYTTEIALPKLPKGKYILIASSKKEVKKIKDIFNYSSITMTNLSFVSINKRNQVMVKVLDRSHGNSIQDATILVKGKNFHQEGTTNKHGEFRLYKNNEPHYDLNVTVVHKTDTLSHKGYSLYRYYSYKDNNEDDGRIAKMSLFLDRSIYRPGQIVYFKGVLVEKNKGKTNVVPNTYTSIIIMDANGQELKEFRLKTNEYGSISGEFKIPKNVLTGKFSIEMDEDYGTADEDEDEYYGKLEDIEMAEVDFSVEEYKRPKFEVTFKDVTQNYVLGDSILVSGNAKAFLGTNISEAKVTYSITRNIANDWSRSYNSSSKQIIKTGTTQTDARGNFAINFIATPDSLAVKEHKPVFIYAIETSVTDINGETRSATKIVRVGFHNIKLDVSIGGKLDQSFSQEFNLETKNLNDQPIDADVEVTVYKLSSPNRVLRTRPWLPVELPSIDKETFLKLFPHEIYDNKDLKAHWEKGDLVLSKKFKSQDVKKVALDQIKDWKSGTYILQVKATDIFKDEVFTEKTFEVYNPEETQPSDHKLFSFEVVNSNYKKDGYVALKLRTAADILYANVQAYYEEESIFKETVPVVQGSTIVKIPVKKAYKGSVDFNIYFSKFNSLYSKEHSVSFPQQEKLLNIETLSFRNKLTPDMNETWSFKITNSNQKAAQAELLASMYDTSLDQFQKHNWNTQLGFNEYNYYNSPRVDTDGLFSTKQFKILKRSSYHYSTISLVRDYHRLRWFGFNFGQSEYANRTYLRGLKAKAKPKKASKVKGNINGIVADESGSLPGVSVLVKGTTTGTETDFDGFYSLNAPVGSELIFSYLGYQSHSLTVDKSGTHNVLLKEDANTLDEIVVTAAYSTKRKTSVVAGVVQTLQGRTSGVKITKGFSQPGNAQIIIRGTNSVDKSNQTLFVVDGRIVDLSEGWEISQADIDDVSVLKGSNATAIYGNRGRNGVVIITTKKGLEELAQIEIRDDLKETAFFFPHLRTNKKGEVFFSFNSPQALTKWSLMLLAHSKSVETGSLNRSAVTQKEINVIPNAPRFLRENDTVVLSAKIANLTKEYKSGTALLQLFDAFTMQPISQDLIPLKGSKNFTIPAKGNTSLNWTLHIPKGLQALQYKIVAKSGTHSDGEASILPVLSNRMLVTESKPLWVPAGKTQRVSFSKLGNPPSKTQENHKFVLEYTSNPAWLAIKSLPYLMEFPYECAEQTFSRLYANTLASDILEKNPKIEEVFKTWQKNGQLESPLDKNDELKSIILEESPWVRDLQKDATAKAQLAKLFNKDKVNEQQLLTLSKLKELQMQSGGFPWFAGGRENPFITRHILAGIGHLEKLNIKITEYNTDIKHIVHKAVAYLDREFIDYYHKGAIYRKTPSDVSLSSFIIHYLYARSFFTKAHPASETLKKIINIYLEKGKEDWLTLSLYNKGLLSLVYHRNGDTNISKKMIEALGEQAVESPENGMYWKENTQSWYWYQSPIETQALMIEAFAEIDRDIKKVDQLKQWLLKNKQTNQWSTTKATTEAIYALLMHGSDWLSVSDNTIITIGKEKIKTKKLSPVQKEAGTGYMKLQWNKEEMSPKMSSITVKNKSSVVGYGGVYWQYFEDLDKITSVDSSPLQIKKSLFLKEKGDQGERLIPITQKTAIKVGGLVTVRIEIVSKNDMEFVHLKDLRASGLEPIDVLSKYKWQDGLGYYQSTKDVATHFFFDDLPKGTYVFEYDLRANNSGNFSNGITTIQSMYAPEFTSHSKGIRIEID